MFGFFLRDLVFTGLRFGNLDFKSFFGSTLGKRDDVDAGDNDGSFLRREMGFNLVLSTGCGVLFGITGVLVAPDGADEVEWRGSIWEAGKFGLRVAFLSVSLDPVDILCFKL
ncbi:hypothetical protein ACLKA6_018223 [Drosophila palustris]